MCLKELRKQKGYTQKDLGICIGVSQQYISKIENGNIGSVTVTKIQSLSKALDIGESYLYLVITQRS